VLSRKLDSLSWLAAPLLLNTRVHYRASSVSKVSLKSRRLSRTRRARLRPPQRLSRQARVAPENNDFVFTIIDANHHTEDWTFKLAGDQLLHAHFDLKRN
jgi:hypothetical protein